jgi:hypothetical protein
VSVVAQWILARLRFLTPARLRRWLIAYAVVNALLYSLLQPLWEGFDEPFHFGYVQYLSNGQGLPDPRKDHLSLEVGTSLLLAPASREVKHNLPQVTSFDSYFELPLAARIGARGKLDAISVEQRSKPSQFTNYEAHHPPLAYLLLAPIERLFAGIFLRARVAILRIVVALAGSLLLLAGAEQLFPQLGIPEPFDVAALFCLLSSQMLWATIAHVANDWFAVPIATWALVALNRYFARSTMRGAVSAAGILSAGLLTKAYFLAFLPVFAVAFALRRRWRDMLAAGAMIAVFAGPWYLRNIARYGVLTGTQEARGGVGLLSVLRGATSPQWVIAIPASLRWAVWTGNNSFLSFSSHTLNFFILACSIALLLWAVSHHTSAEWITFAYCAIFVLALVYAGLASYVYTHGVATSPSPWYAQAISAPLLGLASLGASRWRSFGSVIACVIALVAGYILAATYALKLIPWYGGYAGNASAGPIFTLYTHHFRTLSENLNSVAMAPAGVIFALAAIAIALAAGLAAVVTVHLIVASDYRKHKTRYGIL